MKTSEQLKKFEQEEPKLLKLVRDNIEDFKDYRWIDSKAININKPYQLQYIITLLVDELVSLTNDNITE